MSKYCDNQRSSLPHDNRDRGVGVIIVVCCDSRGGPYYTLLAFSIAALVVGVVFLKETKTLVYREQSDVSGTEVSRIAHSVCTHIC